MPIPEPRIVEVGFARPDLVIVRVESGRKVIPPVEEYRPKPGWKIHPDGFAVLGPDEKPVGFLVGPDRKFRRMDRLEGKIYKPSPSAEDYAVNGRAPVAVGLKSKPMGLARVGWWDFEAEKDDRIYLRLASPLRVGTAVKMKLPGFPVRTAVYAPASVRSEAIHVNGLGYRPGDPGKRAYLSLWAGTMGAVDFAGPRRFSLVNGAGKTVFSGPVEFHKSKNALDDDAYKRPYTKTDVCRMDFGEFRVPGRYRLRVDGVGTSYPFPIAENVYAGAFKTSMHGLYAQRSGIAHGAPYSTYRSIIGLNPADGRTRPVQSTTPLMDTGNGLNAKGDDVGNFKNLVAGITNVPVPESWGGYHDAADWDSRIQHLETTRQLLELRRVAPTSFARKDIPLPENGNGLPPTLNEALWNIDHYRRLQTADGGIRGGMEQDEHPRVGETSWLNTRPCIVYAPDPWCSYLYAATAARAADVLREYDAKLATDYRESGERAYRWAVANEPNFQRPKMMFAIRDAKNLAAIELFRLTKSPEYLATFEATTVFTKPDLEPDAWMEHDQDEAAFSAIFVDGVPETIRANCRSSVLKRATDLAGISETGSFGVAKVPFAFVGYGSAAGGRYGVPLVQAHYLTKDARFLAAAVRHLSFTFGANPSNLTYMTGVGPNPIRHACHIDSAYSGQPAPAGITVYGPLDPALGGPKSLEIELPSRFSLPSATEFPAWENYFDSFHLYGMNEFTIDGSMGNTSYVLAYLSDRK